MNETQKQRTRHTTPKLTPSAAERFRRYLEPGPNGCIVWKGAKTSTGYGMFGMDGRSHTVHRLAYTTERGRIPDGMDIDHVCSNRLCVNPDHMQPVTRSGNMQRAWERRSMTPEQRTERTIKYQGRSKVWVARQLGVSRQTLNEWLNSKIPPDYLPAIERVLGISFDGDPATRASRDGERLLIALKAQRRSKAWLARHLDIPASSLALRMETGFSQEERERIAAILDVPAGILFAHSDDVSLAAQSERSTR